ncbi:diiron oxygenase [Streptomyces sp. CB00455]|uniref:diiron oxygenase n=1 Tax=Streptomyces sp. CB00455 TaxID=1703927 RepID=UPI00093FC3AC|nr:diiron oxygenase [Streptomyces sp. CB00455]
MALQFASTANRTVLARRHQNRLDQASVEADYRSRFRTWERVATVRNNPVRMLDGDGELFFSPELVPALSHPLLQAAEPHVRETVLVHRLYEYLTFTIDLEQSAVIPVTGHISRGMSGLDLPEPMRLDAFKIVTDEAWHAQFTYEILRQVRTRTRIDPALPSTPTFTSELARIHEELPAEIRGLDEMLFAIVSETLISSILDELPEDKRLPEGVRDMVADHAVDEAKHHSYFSTLLRFLWPAMSRKERELAGPYIPQLIFAFLEPDYTSAALGLSAAGLGAREVEQVMSDVYTRDKVVDDVRRGAAPTLQYFVEAGALKHGATLEAFQESGLIA